MYKTFLQCIFFALISIFVRLVPLVLLVHTEELRRGPRQLQRASEEAGTVAAGERMT